MLNQISPRWVLVAAVVAVFGMLIFSPAIAQKKDVSMATMSSFLVISPHTPEECLSTLDEVSSISKGALDKWYWGCMAGDHTGYEIVQAESETLALQAVPVDIRAKAHAMKLNRFSAEQVTSFHQMKK